MRLHFLLWSFIFFLLPNWVVAQEKTAAIAGAIESTTNEPLPGITVILEGTTRGDATNAFGQFEIKNIQPGSYNLLISGIGYSRQSRAIALEAGQRLKIDIHLEEDSQQLDEIVVRGETEAGKLIRSAKAVNVIETKTVKLQTADLGEIIAQTQGVNVRRSGGLGSGTRFSMNGLTNDQIRFFLNGIPLQFTGYSFGIANVPVNLIDRVELYKGVVPIQFGADALGGIVNLVSPKVEGGLHGEVSYQIGSFGTHRISTNIQFLNENTGFFFNSRAFYDFSKNNYEVDVEVPDEKGRLSEATVPRFHDTYKAIGINAQTGFRNKSWAREASLTLFTSDFSKDIQHNNVMSIPYGEATFHRRSHGAMLHFLSPEKSWLETDVLIGYSYEQRQFLDTALYVYNWFGERIRERGSPGELGVASNQFLWDNNLYGRINLNKDLGKRHSVAFSAAPTFVSRTGDEKRQTDPEIRDPLTAQRDLFTWVNGLEYIYHSSNGKLKNRLFFKNYLQNVRSEEAISANRFQRMDRNSNFSGIGNSMRYGFTQQLSLKASYEWSTRLPRTEEIFGDGMLTLANLELKPERSHNANIELSYQNKASAANTWQLSMNGFLRVANQLIVLLGDQNTFSYQNVFDATSAGLETSASWASSDNRWKLSSNFTWQSFRNTSDEGAFRGFKGDRIPNRPYLFANGALSYQWPELIKNNDALNIFWNARYIHGFFRTWESAGISQFKQTIPAQFINNAGATYKLPLGNFRSSLTAEVQNLTNAKVFDFFGVQRPGRAYYFKLTVLF